MRTSVQIEKGRFLNCGAHSDDLLIMQGQTKSEFFAESGLPSDDSVLGGAVRWRNTSEDGRNTQDMVVERGQDNVRSRFVIITQKVVSLWSLRFRFQYTAPCGWAPENLKT